MDKLNTKIKYKNIEMALFKAFVLLNNQKESEAFLHDLCTPLEIKILAERWRVCQLLDRGDLSYRDINALTGASLTTIGRVARTLRNTNYQGYQTILRKLSKKEKL